MSSNNPFASAMATDEKPHRDPPPPPTQKTPKKPPHIPPPSYEEAAGPRSKSKEYPQEKQSSSSPVRHSRPHRSHSDSTRHPRKERDRERDRDRRDRDKKKSSSKKSPSKKSEARNLDVIDKLDVSSFFGGRFHHDGPFDACTPHRNRNVKAAPVMAFPADGPNNSMKARVNNDDSSHMNLAFGNYEDHNTIVGSTVPRASNTTSPYKQPLSDPQISELPRLNPSVVAFDVNQKAVPIHGPSTEGLGSTTFVDGAPAPKAEEQAIQQAQAAGGLGRKKSIVHRLRKNSAAEGLSGRRSSEVSENGRTSFGDEEGGNSLLRRVKSLKVGRK
ncbi:hypothetical protein PUMCH_000298 [Australozyma saopauloensis]|uniref:Uncharacterized protein n=1 Tax=Australozyma saopauloensis TaxID=291208 RepID=A0AAX4H3E0_9ASCO|nr:hypothetical protein PUMCH_000298 [[Candida] saopauloensis]